MGSTWVLKFQQVDLPNQPFLVHVTQKKGLDLDLLATDGEVAYRGRVRERNLSKAKGANYKGTDEEWLAILRYTLISQQNSGIDEDQRKNLEVQCAVSGKGSKAVLAITIRTRIEDITSRLGAIELAFSDDTDDVDLFGWASAIIDQRDGLTATSTNVELQLQQERATIQTLQKELADLLKAKEEHEEQMLSKFTILLNEKKSKIRNLQRVLETAKVDPRALENLRLTESGDRKRSDKNTRNTRKRKGQFAMAQADEEESDGFDSMDIDRAPVKSHAEVDTDIDSQATASASENEDEADPVDSMDDGLPDKTTSGSHRELSPLPPPRNLPFQKKTKESKESKAREDAAAKTATAQDDNDTASEDDEL